MKRGKLIGICVFVLLVIATYSMTWIFLTKVDAESNNYDYGDSLGKELYNYQGNKYYYGPKDESSYLISYNNAIIKKEAKTNKYKLVLSLDDEENTLMKDNYFFYKNYFYLIHSSIVIYNLDDKNPDSTKKVVKGYFDGNISVEKVYGQKNKWIYIKVKLYKENSDTKWYVTKYFKIKYDGSEIKEISKKNLPEFK